MDDLLDKAKESHKKNNLKVARTLYEKLLESDPKNTDAFEGLVDCLYKLGYLNDALKKSEEALKLDPNLLIPHVVLAYISNYLGEINKSREEAKIALELKPYSAEALCCYGVMLTIDNKFGEAVHYLKSSIQIDPDNYLAHYNLSVCYQQLRDARSYHAQEKNIFRLKPNFRNLVALIGSYFLINTALRVLVFVGPIILYLMNLKPFLIVHFFMIFLYVTAGVISLRNRQLSYFRSNLLMVVVFVVVDVVIIVVSP